MTEIVELLSPAGDWSCLRAAIANGADAVYFGLDRFNARMRAHNFTVEQLPEIVGFCHTRGVRAYVALNILVFTDELEDAAEYLRDLSAAGADAILVQDIGLARLARRIVPDLPLHASTQMTITSPEGVELIRELGIARVVLARELSLREIRKFDPGIELEVFVHGALCIAYSGQCLTSEALGRRSANRGECAQACRMPYALVADGRTVDLGDRRYLLSPQDLAGIDDIPALIEAGVTSFKIEGRLKSPEYVAAVTAAYRKAIDAARAGQGSPVSRKDRYALEMTFSRGFCPGWIHGVNHQRLVSARFGKKRGPLLGTIARIGRDHVELGALSNPVKPGDGVCFDQGGDPDHEQGGRVFAARGTRLYFGRGKIDFAKLNAGDRVWKTDDPILARELRQTYAGKIRARTLHPIDLAVSGKAGEPLRLEVAVAGREPFRIESSARLDAARTAPLSEERLREHLGRLGESGYCLRELRFAPDGPVILPIGELNELRRAMIGRCGQPGRSGRRTADTAAVEMIGGRSPRSKNSAHAHRQVSLAVLCRNMEQVRACLDEGVRRVYADFEDIRRYQDAVATARDAGGCEIWLATPRIQKVGEEGFFKLIAGMNPDGVLVRNLGGVRFFAGAGIRAVGDFSLNVANPLSAEWFVSLGLEWVTVSYDLEIGQVLALLRLSDPDWFEIALHQQIPMFHMEHCLFAAFLSGGTDHTNCGRPCDRCRLQIRDRVGVGHPVLADAGCRNTVFNAVAQTGARFFGDLLGAGLRRFRVELLTEGRAEAGRLIRTYADLVEGRRDGDGLWRELKATSQLGVTSGTFAGMG